MKTKVPLFIVVLAMLAATAWGQAPPRPTDTIWLAGVQLQLGLSRGAALARLADCCLLRRLATDDDWSVQSKSSPPEDYGQVSFSNGKLALVAKDWTTGGEDDFSFAQTLHGALEQFGREGKHVCTFDADSARTPIVERRTITLLCGTKRLVIETAQFLSGEHKGTKSTTIQELLTSAGNQ